MSETSHIGYAVADGIGTITIDRPEKRNAMTYDMLGAFIDVAGRAGADDEARVVIVTGSGGSFCAGTDLADLATVPGKERNLRGASHDAGRWWPLVSIAKPVIGAIDGAAVGMGAEFTSQCDVRIASTRARFSWNFAHRGLVPDTGSWLLPRIIGVPAALRLLYSGAFLDAQEALAIGYVAEVVEPADLLAAARAEAERMLASSPMSLRLIKSLVYGGLASSVGDHMANHTEALAACFASEDHREGVDSFLERRPAHFVGR